ncbi:hypothetical protein QJS04_geneDACA019119 [Acorus gramineus]|uniref:Uncharacterized protein n=1 Tax=Acorus gramineus TaxID=55184 RepID=A0AAV9AA17_ACOGR|nr:hypothetical protein QJS04_geneDACA019119 [Acorus gramineus]
MLIVTSFTELLELEEEGNIAEGFHPVTKVDCLGNGNGAFSFPNMETTEDIVGRSSALS